jgi:hypothetical protein
VLDGPARPSRALPPLGDVFTVASLSSLVDQD